MKGLKIKTIFLAVLAIDVLLFLVWVGTFFLVRNEIAKIEKLEQEKISLEEKRDNMSTLSRLAEETKEGRTLLSNFFVSPSAESGLMVIEELNLAAKRSGVAIEIKRAENKDNLSLEFKVKGSYAQVFHFLTLTENLPFGLKLEALDLGASSLVQGKKGEWTASLILSSIEGKKL